MNRYREPRFLVEVYVKENDTSDVDLLAAFLHPTDAEIAKRRAERWMSEYAKNYPHHALRMTIQGLRISGENIQTSLFNA